MYDEHESIVAYSLKARTVLPEKQPLLCNGPQYAQNNGGIFGKGM
jgi:hypothetical protein